MKLRIYLLTAFLINASILMAQDEGVIEKKERIARNKSVYIDLGPSLTLGKNIGDYKAGLNAEVGYNIRLNRLLSIGPSISYVSFKYDAKVTSANGGDAYIGNGDPNDWDTKYGTGDYDYGFTLNLTGGDINLTSLGVNFKFNFVPVKDKSIISAYFFAKPFVSYSYRTAVTGAEKRYTYETYEDDNGTATTNDDVLHYNLGDETWYADGYEGTWSAADGYPSMDSQKKVTGGIFFGPGIELFPARKFSGFLQASFGYTLPVSFVSTKSYDNTLVDYFNDEFPMVKKGFPSVNLQLGFSFNF